jgi:hypothetical protein
MREDRHNKAPRRLPCTRDQRLAASLDTVRRKQRSSEKRGHIYPTGSLTKGGVRLTAFLAASARYCGSPSKPQRTRWTGGTTYSLRAQAGPRPGRQGTDRPPACTGQFTSSAVSTRLVIPAGAAALTRMGLGHIWHRIFNTEGTKNPRRCTEKGTVALRAERLESPDGASGPIRLPPRASSWPFCRRVLRVENRPMKQAPPANTTHRYRSRLCLRHASPS